MKRATGTNASRRRFLTATAAAGAAALLHPARGAAQKIAKTQVWVQLTTGGKPYPPTLQEMFLDPVFFGMEVWPIDQPASFAALLPAPPAPTPARGVAPTQGRGALGGGTERDEPPDYPWEPSGGRPHPGYDVLVLNDQMDWPEPTRKLAQQAVEAGKGFVLLHHSLGDNQDWPWWYQEVTGGLLVLGDREGMKRSTVGTAANLDVRPAGKHPILRHTKPFTLTGEECSRACGSRRRLRRCSRPRTAAAIRRSRGSASIRRREWSAFNREPRARHTATPRTGCS
jgi:hypothetical protein